MCWMKGDKETPLLLQGYDYKCFSYYSWRMIKSLRRESERERPRTAPCRIILLTAAPALMVLGTVSEWCCCSRCTWWWWSRCTLHRGLVWAHSGDETKNNVPVTVCWCQKQPYFRQLTSKPSISCFNVEIITSLVSLFLSFYILASWFWKSFPIDTNQVCVPNIRSGFMELSSRWRYSSSEVPFKPL